MCGCDRLPGISGSFVGRGQWGGLSYPRRDDTFRWGKVFQRATMKCSTLSAGTYISAVKQEHSRRLLRCMARHIWPFGFKRIFILAQTGLWFNPEVIPEVLQVPPEFVDEGWTVRWRDTRGLVWVLKPLLFLFFGFMGTLAVTQRSVLGWQEFSALSIGPRDAGLAVIAFQIGIGVHECGGRGSGSWL